MPNLDEHFGSFKCKKHAGLWIAIIVAIAVLSFFFGYAIGSAGLDPKDGSRQYPIFINKQEAAEQEQTTEDAENPLGEVKTNPLEDVTANPYESVKFNPFE